MLTETEIKKLLTPAPARDKSNDFIVRRKFKKWLDESDVVYYYILQHLPQKQVKKLVKREHIQHIMNILLCLLSTMTAPMVQMGNEFKVIGQYSAPRLALQEEVHLRNDTKEMVLALFSHLSAEDVRGVIQTELEQHQPEYILAKPA
jgi:hypothetical protein